MPRQNRQSAPRRAGIGAALAALVLPAVLLLAWSSPVAAQDDKPTLAITQVDLAGGTIVISNHGDAEVDPNGIILCNFPAYAPIDGADPIAPGESATIDAAAAGVAFDAASGEMGLYLTAEYEDPNAIVSYVEWGDAGHQRSSVAQAAGIWSDGAVDPAGEATLTATTAPPVSAQDWVAGSGDAPAEDAADDEAAAVAEDEAAAAAEEDAAAAEELPQTGVESMFALLMGLTLITGGVMVLALRRQLLAALIRR